MLTSMANLALTFSTQGRWTEAGALQVQVLELRKSTLESEYPDPPTSMDNLARAYHSNNYAAEAGSLMEDVVKSMNRIIGENHPDSMKAMSSLGDWQRNMQITSWEGLKDECSGCC